MKTYFMIASVFYYIVIQYLFILPPPLADTNDISYRSNKYINKHSYVNNYII